MKQGSVETTASSTTVAANNVICHHVLTGLVRKMMITVDPDFSISTCKDVLDHL